MRFRFLTPLMLLACLGLVMHAGTPAHADGLDPAEVPASVDWVAHVDVEGMLDSAIGAFALQEMKKPDTQAGLTVLRNLSGVDPTRDLSSITIFGQGGGEEQHVLIVEGRFERDKLLALLGMNPTLRQMDVGGRTLYEWQDEPDAETPGPKRWGTFYDDSRILIAGNRAMLDRAITALGGGGETLAAARGQAGEIAVTPTKGAFLGVYVRDFSAMPHDDPGAAALFEKVTAGRMEIGQTGENAFARLTLHTDGEPTANNFAKMAEGFLAFLDLAKDLREDGRAVLPPVAATMLEDVRVTTRDAAVEVSMTTPARNVTEALQWAATHADHKH